MYGGVISDLPFRESPLSAVRRTGGREDKNGVGRAAGQVRWSRCEMMGVGSFKTLCKDMLSPVWGHLLPLDLGQ